jgi:hypothetical protein
MKTVIVPLDFSETSFNAAHYAAKMYCGDDSVTLILYHFYSKGEDVATANNYLGTLKTELLSTCSNIETISESGDNLIDSFRSCKVRLHDHYGTYRQIGFDAVFFRF